MSGAVRRLVILLGVLAWGTPALAQEEQHPTLGFKMMNSSQNPFPLHVDARNSKPAGIDLALVEQALQNAARTWEDVPDAYTDFDYKGQTTVPPDPNDGINVIAWVTSTSDPLYENSLYGEASRAIPLRYAGALYQCDIVLNAVDYRWSALPPTEPMPAGYMDLESVLLRELGHCQGLAHFYSSEGAVMGSYLGEGERRRGLTTRDIEQIRQNAPQAGAVGSPCPANTCTNGLACLTTQAPDGATVKLCGKGCTGSTPGECPDPYVCRAYTGLANYTNACQPPTSAVTQVGRSCTASTVASACGNTRALCREPLAQPSGSDAWQAGYCTQACGTGQPACPSGSVCGNPGAQVGTERICLKSCRPGTGDCRPGYTCDSRTEGNVCVPECQSEADCQANGGSTDLTCRTCDNICVPRLQGGKSVGETCEAATECGAGMVCLRYLDTESNGVCALPCSKASCGCPNGSTCQPVGRQGEPLCVANCTPGSCPLNTLCTPSGEGSACLPLTACEVDADCPKTFRCSLTKKCFDPSLLSADAGTCSLCGPDGGAQQPPPPPPPTDGGTDGGVSGPGGCGCQGAPASAMALFAALALLFAARRGHRN